MITHPVYSAKNKTLSIAFRRSLAGYLGLIPALALLVGSAHAQSEILIRDGQKVAFLGDSITAGGWGQPGGYVRLVVDALKQKGIKITPIPVGVGGNTSRDMLARLGRDVLGAQPDWMTLSCGVNDVWHGERGVDLETYKKNIAAIVSQAKASGIKVVVLTSTPIGEDENSNNQKLAAYNEFLIQLAKDQQLPLADLSSDFWQILKPAKTTGSSRILTNDGVHMNPNGNVLMAKGCLRAMGFTPADLEATEQAWLKAPNTACFSIGSLDFRPNIGITLAQYRSLEKVAQSRNCDMGRLASTLWLRAVAEVVQSQSQDSVLDLQKVQRAINALLESEIQKLCAGAN